ncbi:hypothetical protein [Streptomyces sp. TLI_146]|uniref:hypothetical protein n=1 Tax=Streptomyces sp. TLI_146 TaxID=1938858 RepID=UPI000C7131EF|nr:hypothetical protein [Streptomyces sp. TLI_146]PKV86229.1 hypothetical protein BX283_3790 [Streptomyces sp. TLI_146]
MPHRSRRALGAVAALALLTAPLTACGSDALERCVPVAAESATPGELIGRYEGAHEADGVRLTLSPGGAMRAEKWPTGDYHRAKLGKTFDGSGTWEIESATASTGRALLRLHFTKPTLFLQGDTLDKLTIGIDATRTDLYQDTDPDICPDFRLRRHKP